MLKKRLIPVLILREGKVVQSIQFQHTNIIHWKPVIAVDFFNRWAVDEIVVLDVSKDLKNRQDFYETIIGLSSKCFVPLTVGGWITNTEEVKKLLRLGADKVVINTEAFRRPEFIKECVHLTGSQCVVVSIDGKKHSDGSCEVYIDRGSEPTGASPVDWAKKAEEFGAGEIFFNCIDHDGFRQGYDLELLREVVSAVSIPVIAMGGVLTRQHLVDGILIGGADAVAAANIFHYIENSTKKAKVYMREHGIDVR